MDTQIIVLDFGSQVAHLISRRVRMLNVYSEVVPSDISVLEIQKRFPNLKGIILSGGPSSIYANKTPRFNYEVLNLGIPVLGICYGHHLIAHHFGGKVQNGQKEYGIARLKPKSTTRSSSNLFQGCKSIEKVWMNHGDSVFALPKDFKATAITQTCKIAAYENTAAKIYGVQFHPEVTHTANGQKIFENFVLKICKSKQNWRITDFINNMIAEIRQQVGNRKAILGLSGGIDSACAALLMSKAIGPQLVAVFVDTGYMRLDEPRMFKETFSKFAFRLKMVDASEKFYKSLEKVRKPEQKRKIMGKQFIKIFEQQAKIEKAEVLVQGTIYPDRIESGSTKNSSTIKSHHNVGGLPKNMKLELCEPLRDLYKDEVREVAKQLGLAQELIDRHPFPGPGLAIRILGEPTKKRVKILQQANFIVEDELKSNKLYTKTWQAFAVFLPVKSVGVQGDARSYKNVIGIRVVNSIDAMSASFSKLPYSILEKMSSRITNEIRDVNRVVYDITNKPPGTIEWE